MLVVVYRFCGSRRRQNSKSWPPDSTRRIVSLGKMVRMRYLFVTGLLTAAGMFGTGCGEDVVGNGEGMELESTIEHSSFVDAGLERKVRFALERPRGELSEELLLSLQELDAVQGEVGDLEGIDRLANLRRLVLGGNRIRDIRPLTALVRLQFLDLSDNQIEEISALGELGRLHALNLSGNQVGDLSPLADLGRLTHLNIDGNAVEDLSPLASLRRLVLFDADDNRIGDLSPLFGLRLLRSVELSGNPLEDLDALKRLERQGVSVTFYVPFTSPFDPALEEEIREALGGQKGLLTDDVLGSIIVLNITGAFKTLSGIERMKNLDKLFVRFVGTDELAVLRDVAQVAQLQKLRYLTIRDSAVSDLTSLGQLLQLRELSLPGNQISDLSPLADLTRLEALNFAYNQVSDLSPLRRLHRVASINMINNRVSDLAPLLEMQGLKSVWLRGNLLNEKARVEQISSLREQGVFIIGL